jgi:hypothetical protein
MDAPTMQPTTHKNTLPLTECYDPNPMHSGTYKQRSVVGAEIPSMCRELRILGLC